jgi:hypothetical protein
MERVPLLVGGNGDRVLHLTAEHAEIAAFTGARSVRGRSTGQLEVMLGDELEERVARYREMAAGRARSAELNLLTGPDRSGTEHGGVRPGDGAAAGQGGVRIPEFRLPVRHP